MSIIQFDELYDRNYSTDDSRELNEHYNLVNTDDIINSSYSIPDFNRENTNMDTSVIILNPMDKWGDEFKNLQFDSASYIILNKNK